MLFLLESIGACVLFTLMLRIVMAGRQTAFVNDYPPVVTEKLRQLNLIAPKPPARKKDVIRKLIAVIVYAVAFALLLRYVNRIESFLPAMITAYGLWLAVVWYDFLVVDVLLAPFDKFYKASSVSVFEPSAVCFHFKASLRGTLIGLGFAPIVGLLTALL